MLINEYLEQAALCDIDLHDALNPSNLDDAFTEFINWKERNPLNPQIHHVANDALTLRHPNFRYDNASNLSLGIAEKNLEKLGMISDEATHAEGLTLTERSLLNLVVEDYTNKNQILYQIWLARRDPEHQDDYTDAIGNAFAQYCSYHPDDWVAQALLKEQYDAIKAENLTLLSDQQMYRDLQKQLEAILPQLDQIKDTTKFYFYPQIETITQFKQIFEQFFAKIFAYLPDQAEFTAAEVCELLNNILVHEFPQSSFRAVVDENIKVFFNDQIKRIIHVPAKRAKGPYTYDVVKALILAHEFCTHVLRSIFYENCGITAFYRGLPNYGDFDEGIASSAQHAIDGTPVIRGIEHYVNAWLAGCREKDFRQIYDIRLALNFLAEVSPNEDPAARQKRLQRCQSDAFNQARRAFRGTSTVPVFLDLSYFKGTNAVWRFIEENIESPQQLMETLAFSGKTNPLLETHCELLKAMRDGKLGTMPTFPDYGNNLTF